MRYQMNCHNVSNKVGAIKAIRSLTLIGLKEAKDLVEETMPNEPGYTGASWSEFDLRETDPARIKLAFRALRSNGATVKAKNTYLNFDFEISWNNGTFEFFIGTGWLIVIAGLALAGALL